MMKKDTIKITVDAIKFAEQFKVYGTPEFDLLILGYIGGHDAAEEEGSKEYVLAEDEKTLLDPSIEPVPDRRNISELPISGRLRKAIQRYFILYLPDKPMQACYVLRINVDLFVQVQWTGLTATRELIKLQETLADA